MSLAPVRRRPATITAVATACGVAKSTVSKALSLSARDYEVSPALRQRIREVAAELGYQPARARRPRLRRPSGAIAMIYGIDSPPVHGVYQDVLALTAQALDAAGFLMLCVPIHPRLSHWEALLGNLRLDGCIVLPPLPNGIEKVLLPAALPTVVLNHTAPAGLPAVETDDAGGARLAAEHLLGLGHRRLAYVDFTPANAEHTSNRVRREAFAAAVRAAGLPVAAPLTSAAALRRALSRRTDRPTALFGYSHKEAAVVLATARELGVRIPAELSLISCNDVHHLKLFDPPLTVISPPMNRMALRAAEMVLDLIAQRPVSSLCAAQDLVIRGSTGPAPG